MERVCALAPSSQLSAQCCQSAHTSRACQSMLPPTYYPLHPFPSALSQRDLLALFLFLSPPPPFLVSFTHRFPLLIRVATKTRSYTSCCALGRGGAAITVGSSSANAPLNDAGPHTTTQPDSPVPALSTVLTRVVWKRRCDGTDAVGPEAPSTPSTHLGTRHEARGTRHAHT